MQTFPCGVGWCCGVAWKVSSLCREQSLQRVPCNPAQSVPPRHPACCQSAPGVVPFERHRPLCSMVKAHSMRDHRSDSTDGLVAAAAAEGSIAPGSSAAPGRCDGTSTSGRGTDHAPADGFETDAAAYGSRLAANGSAAAASSDSTPMLQQQDDSAAATTGLLQRFDAMPTGSRLLQGLRDLAMLVVVVVPFLVLRAARYILVWLGITEHRWVPVLPSSSGLLYPVFMIVVLVTFLILGSGKPGSWGL